ncbi:MAG: response regulator [Candidatus Nitrospinota bacterium M3_3B_026]
MADIVLAGEPDEQLGGIGRILEGAGEAVERVEMEITDPAFAGRLGNRRFGVIISRFHEGDLASIKAMQSIRIDRPFLSFIFISDRDIPASVLTLMFNEGAYGALSEPLSESSAARLVKQAIKKSRWSLDEAGLKEELKRSNETLRMELEEKEKKISRLEGRAGEMERLCYFLLSDRSFRPKTIKTLFVSDSAYQRGLIEERFARAGFQVIGTDSAENALREIKNFKPDIVVSDLELPGMSGLELAREVKGGAGYPPVHFVILTAGEGRAGSVLAPGTMVDDLVIKPAGEGDYDRVVAEVSLGILRL